MIANQSLGVRIRYFRKKKGFTQKELGEAIGVNDSTIRNYELGNRTPDANTMAKIAEALDIDFYTLKSTEVNSVDSAVHALFDIEDRYGLVPDKIGDNICLVLDQADSSAYPDRTDTEISEFNTALLSWYKARISLLDGKVDEDTYMTWKEKYPGYSAIDENGTPYIPSVRKKEEAARDEDMEFKYKMYVSAKEWAGETDILSYEEFAARSN